MTTIAHGAAGRARGIDPATGRPSSARTLWSIQCLRAVAALMVVAGHAQSAIAHAFAGFGRPFDRVPLPWGAGVDLFFVISGFVMVHASRTLFGSGGGAAAFLKRRLARIVPLYWLATALFLLLLAAAHWKGGDRFPEADAILASLLFLPFDTWREGGAFPVFDLGWTLNYELFFYLLFGLCIVLPRRRALAALLLALALLVAAGTQVAEPLAARFWTRPIIIDFALGVTVGWLEAEGTRLPAPVRAALAAGGAALFAIDPAHLFAVAPGVTVANGFGRVFAAGLPAAALIAAATLGTEPARPRALVPLLGVGDASYSLYLLHPFALILVEKLLQKSETVRAAPAGLLVGAVMLMALLLAFASFRWFERPLTRLLTRAPDTAPPTGRAWRSPMPGRQR